jgi:malate synthase
VLRNQPDVILPDRQQVTMTVPMMRAYTLLAIKTCHKRGAHAIGGMAAQIPIKNDPEANREALSKVKEDKEREVLDGHDGTWVAHPGLVPVAKAVFDEKMPNPNQLDRLREDVEVTAEDLLRVPEGTITEAGLRTNIRVGLQYIEEWLRGNGAVAIDHLMEDAATAEISRAQVWQWIRHPKGILEDGRKITFSLFEQVLEEELLKIKGRLGESRFGDSKYAESRELLIHLIKSDCFIDFLTLPGYDRIV